MSDISPRLQVILEELDRDFNTYQAAKEQLETARTRLEIARQRFVATKTLASEAAGIQWYAWLRQHPQLRYFGTPIGDAILNILELRCYISGANFVQGEASRYLPQMTITQIADELEQGGFEFTSTAPAREVNAALINLKGVEKIGTTYRFERAQEILNELKEAKEQGRPAGQS